MQPAQTQPAQPTVSFVPMTTTTTHTTVFSTPLRIHRRTVLILGILQIVYGAGCVAVNGAGIDKDAWEAKISHGIWGGAIFIVTGIMCIVTSAIRNNCMVISTLVLACVSTVVACVSFSLAAVAVRQDRDSHYCVYTGTSYYCGRRRQKTKLALDGLLLSLSICEAAAAVVIIILLSMAIHRSRRISSSHGGQAVMYTNQAMAMPQSDMAGQPMAMMGPTPGAQHYMQPVYQPGMQPVYQPGMHPVYQPGMQPAYLPGMQPAYQQAMQPAQQPAMPPQHGYPMMVVNSAGQYFQVQGIPLTPVVPAAAAVATQPSTNGTSAVAPSEDTKPDNDQHPT